MTRRRKFLKAAGMAGIVSLSGCTSGGNGDGSDGDGGDGGGTATADSGGGTTSGGSSEPVTIGALLPLSGPFARTGQENRRGLEIGREFLGGSIAGRELEVVYKDNESTPSGSVQGARDLVENQDVDAIIGPASSGNSIAVMEYVAKSGEVPLLPTTASSVDARNNCNEYSFFLWPSNEHLVPTSVDFIQKLPEYVDRDIDTTSVHFVSLDYSLGQNNLELVKQEMSSIGGEVAGSTLVPIGESDWSPYISEISSSSADVVTGVLTWGAAAKLIPQATSYGLTEEKTMMFNSGKPVGQYAASTMPEDCVGWFGTHFYDPTLDTEVNNEFKNLYSGLESDILPNSVAGGGFEILRSVAAAVESAGSTETDAVLGALAGLEWESIFGPVKYRESDHQCELNFVGATRNPDQDDDGVPEFEPLQEYPDVIPEPKCDL